MLYVASDDTKNILSKYRPNYKINILYFNHIPYYGQKMFIDKNYIDRQYDYGMIVSNFDRKIKNCDKIINSLFNKKCIAIGFKSEKYESICNTFSLMTHMKIIENMLNIKKIITGSYYESCSNVKIESQYNGCQYIHVKPYNIHVENNDIVKKLLIKHGYNIYDNNVHYVLVFNNDNVIEMKKKYPYALIYFFLSSIEFLSGKINNLYLCDCIYVTNSLIKKILDKKYTNVYISDYVHDNIDVNHVNKQYEVFFMYGKYSNRKYKNLIKEIDNNFGYIWHFGNFIVDKKNIINNILSSKVIIIDYFIDNDLYNFITNICKCKIIITPNTYKLCNIDIVRISDYKIETITKNINTNIVCNSLQHYSCDIFNIFNNEIKFLVASNMNDKYDKDLFDKLKHEHKNVAYLSTSSKINEIDEEKCFNRDNYQNIIKYLGGLPDVIYNMDPLCFVRIRKMYPNLKLIYIVSTHIGNDYLTKIRDVNNIKYNQRYKLEISVLQNALYVYFTNITTMNIYVKIYGFRNKYILIKN